MKRELWQEDFEERLAKAWPSFVKCRQRMFVEGPFLSTLLKRLEKPRVLDAATGIGCEATWLLTRGYDVTANEYCPVMRRMATEHASENGVRLRPFAYDWRDFDSCFRPDSFNVILLLGNSLCLLHKKADRVKVARNLFRVCTSGGLLVVDERNFRYIMDERSKILKGKFRYSRRVMYCGARILGHPTSISPRNVTFTYYEASTGSPVGRLDMYPFKEGELRSLFENVGFKCESLYSDLKKGTKKTADFYTYVFTKPLATSVVRNVSQAGK